MAEVLQEDGITIVVLDDLYDSLDEEKLQVLSDLLLETVGGPDQPRLLLDLSKTRFVGSLFIGLLVRVWKRIRDRNGQMGVCCLTPFCREALTAARLYDTLWSPYEDRSKAISAMRRPA